MAQSYVPPHKRKRVDSLEPEAPTTSTAEVSSKKLKLSTKISSRTTTTSSRTTAWSSRATKPSSPSSTSQSSWAPGASKHLFPSSTPQPIIRGPSTSSYTQSQLLNLRPQSLASSESSANPASDTNTSSWRATMGASLKPKPAAIGEIWMIPANSNDVPAGEPIHQHPDFQTKNAWHHPCLVIADPDDKEYLKCFQMTAFSGYPGGLEEKYPGPGNRNQRNRWLLVESSQRQGHDNLPVLKIEKGIFSKPSYVNTEKYFKIKAEHLVPTTKIKLTIGSVDIAKMHHYKYWHDDKMTAAIR